MNQKMLTLAEKIQTAPPLIPMLIEGQPFIDAQDELSVTEFMRKYGMPERINDEVFIAMAKALDFIDPDKLSMTVVLTAMNRFLNEDNGLQMAFLDGNQPDRLCAPMKEHIEKNGGKVLLKSPVKEIVTNDDGTIKHLELRSGEKDCGGTNMRPAMPVDIVKRMVPKKWQNMPYFRQFDELVGYSLSIFTLVTIVNSRLLITFVSLVLHFCRSTPTRLRHLQGIRRPQW
jgi:15-cis-phytoene desaturase